MRISLRRLVPLLVVSATVTCVDSPTGPRGPSVPTTFAISPTFSQSATRAKAMYDAAGLDFDHVRLLITRPVDVVVKDTTVVYTSGQGDLPLELNVNGPVGELLTVKLEYLAGAVVLYSGTTTVQTVSLITPASQVPQTTLVVDPVGPGFDATSVTVTPSSGTFPTTGTVAFSAKAFKAAAEISGALFAWSVDDATVGTIDATGLLHPTAKGGPIKVRATTLNGVFGEVTVTLFAPAASISLVSGGGQSASAGATLTQIVVKIANANGTGVAGEAVTFAVATGGGSIVVNNGTTDASGLARVTWTLGATAGSQSITATSGSLSGSPLTISATATSAVPTKLGFVVQPSTVVAGVAISPAVQVAAQDASGNTVTSFTGSITLAIGTNLGGATLGGTLSVNAIAGVATFNNLTLNAAANGYTLVATTAGLTQVTSSAFNVTGGAATALEFVVQPSNTIQGSAISPPIQVRVKNALGATVNTATNIVTIAIGTNPGGSTLGGNVQAAAVAGVASFSTLTLNNIGTGYTLSAAATGLTGTTSSAFNVVAPAAGVRTWTGAVSTDWHTAGNWNPAGVPTASDSVVIPAVALLAQVSANAAAHSIVVLAGGTLSVGTVTLTVGPGKLTNFSSVVMNATTLAGAIDNQGQVVVQRVTSIGGALTTTAASIVHIQGGNGASASLTVAGGFTNNGIIDLTDTGGFSASLGVTTGTLLNAAAGTIITIPGSSGARTIAAQIDNQGAITVGSAQGLTLAKAGAAHTNSGTIDLTLGNLTLTQSGTTPSFTNTGSITVGSGRKMDVTGGALNLNGGNVSGAGTLDLTGVVADFTPSTLAAALTTDAATSLVGGTVTINTGQSFTLVSAAFSPNIAVKNGGLLVSQRITSITGALTVAAGGTFRIVAPSTTGTTTVANGFTNNGTIELTDTGGSTATLTVTTGVLVNGSTGTVLAQVGGARVLATPLDNQGIVTVNTGNGLTLSKASAAHTNSGTINVTTGSFTVSQSGTTPSFTNTGTVAISASRAWTVTNGALNLTSGVVSGAGTLDLNAVVADFTPATMQVPLTTDAATSLVAGTLTISSGQTVNLLSALFSPNIAVQGGGTLVSQRVTSITGTLTVAATGTVRVLAPSTTGTTTLANGFTNNGTIELTDTGGATATLAITTGGLINASTGTILAQVGGARVLATPLDNQGIVTVNTGNGLTLSKSSAAHTNSGAINVTTGNFTVSQSGTSPSFTNTGTITVGSSRTWVVTGGALNLPSGIASGAGALDLTGVVANFTPATMQLLLTTDAATSIVGGTLTIASGQTVNLVSSVFTPNIAIQGGGTLVSQRITTITGTLTVAASGTLRVLAPSTTGTTTVANGFTNNGTIELTDTGGATATLAITTGTLINVGTILAQTGGARVLAAQLDNQGVVTVSSGNGLTLAKASAAHVNSGDINVTLGNFTLTQSGTSPSFTSTSDVSISANRTFTVNGGAFNLPSGGFFGGAGTLELNGVVADFTPNSMTALLTTDAATSLVAGTLTIGVGQTVNLVSAVFSPNIAVQNSGTLVSQRITSITGTVTVAAGGTFRVLAPSTTGTTTVANGFTNNGTIELTDTGGSTATLAITTGTLTNASTGLILAQTGGARVLATHLINQGTVTVSSGNGLTLTRASAAHTNSGTINVTSGPFTLTQTGTSPSFTNTGAINVASARTWSVTGGALNLPSGLASGAGTLNLAGVVADFTPATMQLLLTTDAATSIVGGTLTIGSGETVNLVSSVFSPNIAILSGGTLVSQRITSITGALTVNGTFRVLAPSTTGTTTVANGFTNNGAIELTDTGGSTASLIVTNGVLVNAPTKTIVALTGGARVLAAQLDNQGIVTVSSGNGLTLSRASAAHTNSGTINVTSGPFTVTQSGTTPSFTNTGTITVASSRTWFVTSGALNLTGGVASGAGTLDLSTVVANFTPATMQLLLTIDASSSILGGTLTIGSGQTVNLVSSQFSSNIAVQGGGLLVSQRITSITGTLTVAASGTFRVLAPSTTGTTTVTNGFTNNGTIELTDTGGATATLAITNGSLTNASGATILAQTGGARVLAAQLVNQGTVTVSTGNGLTLTKASAQHTNSGTINVTSGNFTVTQTGTSPRFDNTNAISVAVSRSFVVNGGFLSLATGLMSGAGTLDLTGVVVNFTPLTMQVLLTMDATSSIFGGSLSIGSGNVVNLVSAVFSSNIHVFSGGLLVSQRITSITGTLDVDQGGTFRVLAPSTTGTTTLANGFTNNGAIELTDTGGATATLAVTTGTLVNSSTGTITALTGGARVMATQLNNQGTVTVSTGNGLTLVGPVTNQSTINVNSGSPLTITGQLNNSGTLNISGNQTVIIANAGAAHTNSGTINLPAITSGTLQIGNTGVTQTFDNSGTISVNSGRDIKLIANTAFTNSATGIFNASFGTLNVAATSTFTNNGSVRPGGTGAAATMNYIGVWNPGSSGAVNIELASGSRDVLAITGAATFAGTLNVSALAGYTPSGTQNHDIMTFTSQTGTFGTINKPGVCLTPTVVTGTILRIGC